MRQLLVRKDPLLLYLMVSWPRLKVAALNGTVHFVVSSWCHDKSLKVAALDESVHGASVSCVPQSLS